MKSIKGDCIIILRQHTCVDHHSRSAHAGVRAALRRTGFHDSVVDLKLTTLRPVLYALESFWFECPLRYTSPVSTFIHMPFISIKGPGPEKPPLPTLDFSRVRRAANGPSWHRLPLATISDDARCILGYDDKNIFCKKKLLSIRKRPKFHTKYHIPWGTLDVRSSWVTEYSILADVHFIILYKNVQICRIFTF